MKTIITSLIILLMVSCETKNQSGSAKDSLILNYENVPQQRSNVNLNAVKTYTETVKSFETTDEFKVSLFETKQTFRYLIKIQYKQLNEEDTLRIPDFGIAPSVAMEKGDSIRPSCIIGFLDEKKQFRESKLIYFEEGSLKIHVLNHYAVATYQHKVQ
ncbi:MAG: hypothetical protein ABJB05_10545 [Parafilimonas sp.]